MSRTSPRWISRSRPRRPRREPRARRASHGPHSMPGGAGPGADSPSAGAGLGGDPARVVLAAVVTFAAQLRQLGIPVSLAELVDAVRALCLTDLFDRAKVRRALRLTMVKHAGDTAIFEAAFDLAFPAHGRRADDAGRARDRPAGFGGGSGDSFQTAAAPDLLARLVAALRGGADIPLDALDGEVVTAFGGLDGASSGTMAGAAGRQRYHYYRVLRQLDVSALLQRSMRLDGVSRLGSLDRRVAAAAAGERLEEFRVALGAELR